MAKPTAPATDTPEDAFPPVTIASRAELDKAVKRMNVLIGRINARRASANAQIAAIETKLQASVSPAWEEYRALEQGVSDYALAHQDALLAGQKGQTLALVGGSVVYRKGVPSVVPTEEPAVLIPRLRQLGLARFVRITEGLDKAAILREPETIEGVEGIYIDRPPFTVAIVPTNSKAA